MTVASSSIPYYISLDVDHDVSGDVLKVTVDKTQAEINWVTATYEASPPAAVVAEALACDTVKTGFTRYWWMFYSGSNTGQIPLVYGGNSVHGHLTDSPAQFYVAWRVNVPRD